MLLKKVSEGEKTNVENDLRLMPAIVQLVRSEDQGMVDLSLRQLMIFCENNPKEFLREFEEKGDGIQLCIEFYTSSKDANLSLFASQILVLYCLDGFVAEINQQGKLEFVNMLLRNFTAEDEKIRIQAIKMMSLLLQDQYIHDIVYQLSDFQFLITDISEMASYDNLYNEEQELLLYVLRIFGEFAKTSRMSENNTTNGIIPICIKIMLDEHKFKKEVRVWALVIINRGCFHQQNDIAEKILSTCLRANPPSFLTIMLNATDPEDTELTAQAKNIWQTLEEFSLNQNPLLVGQLLKSYELVEKLIVGTKRTLNSESNISMHMKNIIANVRTANEELERMVK